MILTQSAKSTFQWCERKFYWRYRRGLDTIELNPYMDIGTLYHKGLAELGPDLSNKKAMMEALSPEHVPEVSHDHMLIARFMCEEYHHIFSGGNPKWASALPGKITDLEITIVHKVARGTYLAGKLDGLIRDDEGRLWIIERKSTYSIDANYLGKVELDGQLTYYCMLAYLRYGEMPVGIVYDVGCRPRIHRREHEDLPTYLNRARAAFRATPGAFFARQIAFRREETVLRCLREVKRICREIQGCARARLWVMNDHVCNVRGRECPYQHLCIQGETPQAMAHYKLVEAHCELDLDAAEVTV